MCVQAVPVTLLDMFNALAMMAVNILSVRKKKQLMFVT
jgi:hypothetical protein